MCFYMFNIPLKYVFVACDDGYFGDMCTQKCSKNCNQAGICNKTTGVCQDGCQPGWMGDFCDSGIFQCYKYSYKSYIVQMRAAEVPSFLYKQ